MRVSLEQAARLNKMIAALLDIAHLQAGQLAIQHAPVDLIAMVRRLVEEIQRSLDRHTIAIQGFAEPLLLVGDDLRLQQVFENLIQNAVKYSPAGGAINVLIERRQAAGNSGAVACVAISDHGIGIPQEAIPQLFSRFYRAANAQQQQIGGAGIGLYVVREIIALHGGSVVVDSVEGQGSTFTVCLPCE